MLKSKPYSRTQRGLQTEQRCWVRLSSHMYICRLREQTYQATGLKLGSDSADWSLGARITGVLYRAQLYIFHYLKPLMWLADGL